MLSCAGVAQRAVFAGALHATLGATSTYVAACVNAWNDRRADEYLSTLTVSLGSSISTATQQHTAPKTPFKAVGALAVVSCMLGGSVVSVCSSLKDSCAQDTSAPPEAILDVDMLQAVLLADRYAAPMLSRCCSVNPVSHW